MSSCGSLTLFTYINTHQMIICYFSQFSYCVIPLCVTWPYGDLCVSVVLCFWYQVCCSLVPIYFVQVSDLSLFLFFCNIQNDNGPCCEMGG